MPLSKLIEAERERVILFTPFCMALGVVGYFQLTNEPSAILTVALFCVSLAITYIVRKLPYLRQLGCVIALGVFGFGLAQYRTSNIEVIALKESLNFAHVSGTLENIEQTPKGGKIYLNNVSIEELPPAQTPKRISLTLKSYDPNLRNGQNISVRAGLFPPPQPALPGGFDFARHYFFRQIGAVGYGMPPVVANPTPTRQSLAILFSELRHRITQSIRSHFDEPAGSIAAAFVTGQTESIPEQVNEDMRIVGLYHLLAVSGLNLSIVAGLAFFIVRLLLATIPALALRYNIKKWAAVAALIVSILYLQIAGSPVSAERAFLMVSLIFIAILLDRDPAPMRAIAASAVIIICLTPEAVLSASFQLSFSATAALVSSYEWVMGRVRIQAYGFGIRRIILYFAAVFGTSLVAWLGTEPFIIYHFNQFSSYSLLTNTIAEPLVSFILMPLVALGVILMPLGLGFIAFTPMQYGVDAVLALARYVAQLPYAMILIPAPTNIGFFVIVCGLVWLYLWRSWLRLLGLPAIIAGFCTAFAYVPPDILISGDGKHIAARMEDGSAYMLKGRSNSFVADQWSRAMLVNTMGDKKSSSATCDKKGCILTLHTHGIAMPKSPDALADDCATAEIVIAANFVVAEGACAAPLVIDQNTLADNGAAAIRFENGKYAVTYAKRFEGARPWQSIASPSDL